MFGNKEEEVTLDIMSPTPQEEAKPAPKQVLGKKEQRRADRKAERQLKKGE